MQKNTISKQQTADYWQNIHLRRQDSRHSMHKRHGAGTCWKQSSRHQTQHSLKYHLQEQKPANAEKGVAVIRMRIIRTSINKIKQETRTIIFWVVLWSIWFDCR